ncbi:unnamed protein product [Rangifer tarandus platyrhynchus]|uniref:Uncharacterized protein n=1 Tax=Rangifer tarandus platyrhynchus TaxID=3082113 RepID=A0AC59ZYV6_RANTA
MRWSDSITNPMDMNLHRLQEIAENKGAWWAAVQCCRVGHDLAIEQQHSYSSFKSQLEGMSSWNVPQSPAAHRLKEETELGSVLGQAVNIRPHARSPSQWTLHFAPGVYRRDTNGKPDPQDLYLGSPLPKRIC